MGAITGFAPRIRHCLEFKWQFPTVNWVLTWNQFWHYAYQLSAVNQLVLATSLVHRRCINYFEITLKAEKELNHSTTSYVTIILRPKKERSKMRLLTIDSLKPKIAQTCKPFFINSLTLNLPPFLYLFPPARCVMFVSPQAPNICPITSLGRRSLSYKNVPIQCFVRS